MRKASTEIKIEKRTLAAAKNDRRRYESPLRQEQAEQTRTRILKAGSYLAHRLQEWDWSKLTARAVASRAKVSERTVYRHFATERELQEAITRRLEEEAGVSYEGLELSKLAEITTRIFESLPNFAASPFAVSDTTTSTSGQRRRKALLQAIQAPTAAWSESERRMATAVLDVLWTPTFYERLLADWNLDSSTAARAVTWALEVLVQAIRAGNRPTLTPDPKSADYQRPVRRPMRAK